MSCDKKVFGVVPETKLLEGLNSLSQDLKKEALTHVSYANEKGNGVKSNERLEFLGDAVISLVTALYLLDKYQDADEGQLTRMRASLVSGESLSKLAVKASLGDFILLGHGEKKQGGSTRQRILAGAFEAVLGAYFLQFGWEKAKEFCEEVVLSETKAIETQDPKTRIQEIVQKETDLAIEYKVIDVEGPDHMPTYTVGLYIGGRKVSEGRGSSKKEAEEKAAQMGLEKGLQVTSEGQKRPRA